MRWTFVVPLTVVGVLSIVSQAAATLDPLCPIPGTVPVVAATEPLAAFALGLGLVGARYFRRRT